MPRLFISYRIDDSAYAAGATADRLAAFFGRDEVFRDRDSLALGTSYPRRIRRALERSDLLVAMVGPSWSDIRDHAGRRRLDDPTDWVRTELRMAFERGIPVVPVLLDHTPLPGPADLPADIAALCRATCWHIRRESFESDVRGLIDGIVRATGGVASRAAPTAGAQYNSAAGGGTVIANQGSGGQHVHGIDLGGTAR